MSTTAFPATLSTPLNRALVRLGLIAAFGLAVLLVAWEKSPLCVLGPPPRLKAQHQSVQYLAGAIDLFRATTGQFPVSLDDLIQAPSNAKIAKKWAGPYLKKDEILTDVWNNPINFAVPGNHNVNGYDVWSLGPDGLNGTGDDIGNWADND